MGVGGGCGLGSVRGCRSSVFPGVDAVYEPRGSAVKETIVLRDRDASSALTYEVRASRGVRARETSAGEIVFMRGRERIFGFAPPFMQDAAGRVSGDVSLRLAGRTPTGWRLELEADRGWLQAPARRFPVAVDPTTWVKDPQMDQAFANTYSECAITAATPDSSCGWPLNVGYDGSKAQRAMMYFNVRKFVPRDAMVLSAHLKLWVWQATTANASTVALHNLTRAFTESASWEKYDGTNPWTTPGGDFEQDAAGTSANPGSPNRYLDFWPTELVQQWVDGEKAETGFLIKQHDEATNQLLSLTSSASGDVVHRPYLDVVYEPRTGQLPHYTFAAQTQLTDRLSLSVNVANGNLLTESADLGIAGTGLDLQLKRYFNNLAEWWSTDFGGGQSLNVGSSIGLQQFGDGSVAFFGPSGYSVPFIRKADGSFKTPSGVDAVLTRNPDGTFALRWSHEEHVWSFDAGGYLTEITDRNGNQISFAYAAGHIDSLTDTQGRTVSFDNNGGVWGITDSANRTVRYSQDVQGDLASFTDAAGKKYMLAYDTTTHSLTEITDPLGHRTLIAYASGCTDWGLDCRVTSIKQVTDNTTGTGDVTTFAYSAPSSPCTTGDVGKTVVTDPNGNATTYCHDPQGRVTKTVDALGRATSVSYTADGNVAQVAEPSGAQQTATYSTAPGGERLTGTTEPTGAQTQTGYGDPAHPFYPTTTTDARGKTTTTTYSATGNPTRIDDPAGGAIALAYNANGTLASSTDPAGNATSYAYDSAGNLTGATPPSPLGAAARTIDGLSRTATSTDGKGQTTTLTYDAMDRITRVVHHDGSVISYVYDADGNLTSQTDATGTTTHAYDAKNRLVETSEDGVRTTTYAYDAGGRLVGLTDAGGTTSYAYDGAGKLTSLTEPGGHQTTFAYDVNDNLTTTSYPNGATLARAYEVDGQGRVTSRLARITATALGGAVISDYSYSYADPGAGVDIGLRQSVTDKDGKKTAYTYDDLGRLTRALTTDGGGAAVDDRRYAYDLAGNRTSSTVNGTSLFSTFNGANELTAFGGQVPTYDANGNLTADGTGTTFAYNAKNQTASVTPAGGTARALTYIGSGQSRRATAGGTTFTNNKLGVGGEAAGASATYYTRAPDGTLVGQRTPLGRYYFGFDGLGSVTSLTDASGVVAATYAYDPYGGDLGSTGSVANPWRFAGEYLDAATGLYKIGERYYQPAWGRWTQQDPIEHVTDPRQSNRFTYAGDDPLNWSDSDGCSSTWSCLRGCLRAHCGPKQYSSAQQCLLNSKGALSALTCLRHYCSWKGYRCGIGCIYRGVRRRPWRLIIS